MEVAFQNGLVARLPVPNPVILLVEDHEPNVFVASIYLSDFGCHYDVARSGNEALEKAIVKQYDLILMDVVMDDMDGFAVTKHIREHEMRHDINPVPIIGLTASALAGDKELCLEAGMNDYLPKPYHADDLYKKICSCLSYNT